MKRITITSLIFAASLGAVVAQGDAGTNETPEQLAGTGSLTWSGPLDVRQREGCHRFIERKIEESLETRKQYWSRDISSAEAYSRSVQPNRERFKRLIGVVDERLPVAMTRFGDDANPAVVAETSTYVVYQVRWPVLAHAEPSIRMNPSLRNSEAIHYNNPVVYGEGLLLEPKSAPAGCVVALPDADQTPEQLAGLAQGVAPESQFARRLAENGFIVVVPVLLNRSILAHVQPQREWIYRQAFHMGRHVIGYEVQKVLAAVDWFKDYCGTDAKVATVGYGEGGLIAFYAAAVDTRIDATLVSGYFDSRQRLGWEPWYRTVWGLLREFGDAEIASLIGPRGLVVEYSAAPQVTERRRKRLEGAEQKGTVSTPSLEVVKAEWARLEGFAPESLQRRALIHGPANDPVAFGSRSSCQALAAMLGRPRAMELSDDLGQDRRRNLDVRERQRQQVWGMEDHVQGLIGVSLAQRNKFYLRKHIPQAIKVSSMAGLGGLDQRDTLRDGFVEASRWYRNYVWEEIFGKVDQECLPLNARSRKYHEDPKWTAYELVLDVWPDVIAEGLLLLPKDIEPGERRPVVVQQGGGGSTPSNALDRSRVGGGVAARLADRGFVVFSPQNLYRGGDDFRDLDKKARSVKLTMWSLMLGQHDAILRWLETLAYVDSSRIGLYGCSFGGTTAMYIPPLLERYCLSICSANFNAWVEMIASTKWDGGYMTRTQWEFPMFNMGNTFSHAELAYLMVPRPFMVERGMYDTAAEDWQVASEYAKVRWLYTQLGIGDRTEIEFNGSGPHGFLCAGSFEFLHKHLRWPAPGN